MERGDRVAADPVREEKRDRKPWVDPQVQDLPKLTDLTLLTGSPIGGGGNTGTGSTVF
jgi:hypothetical protein